MAKPVAVDALKLIHIATDEPSVTTRQPLHPAERPFMLFQVPVSVVAEVFLFFLVLPCQLKGTQVISRNMHCLLASAMVISNVVISAMAKSRHSQLCLNQFNLDLAIAYM